VKAGDAAVKSEKHVSKRGRSAHASASTRQKVPQ
jgi:hypothetical protein